MHRMAAFMHHGGYITHLASRIHKYKGRACFGERTIIPTGSFTLTAIQIKPFHFAHFAKAIGKEGMNLIKTLNAFIQ